MRNAKWIAILYYLLPPGAKIRGWGVLLPCWPLLLRDLQENKRYRLNLKPASRIVIILSEYYSTYLFVGTFVSDRKLFLTERREARICAKGVTMRSSPWLQSKEKIQFIIDISLVPLVYQKGQVLTTLLRIICQKSQRLLRFA